MRISLMTTFVFFILIGCNHPPATQVDLILYHGLIYTSDSMFTAQEAIAIHDGKVVETGSEEHILKKYTAKKSKDLNGYVMYPGFIDAHSHFLGLGLMLSKVDLVGTHSYDDMMNRVETYARNFQGEWIVGRGWNETTWETKARPNKMKLDLMFPETPVCLSRVDGHAVLVNQKALDLAGINIKTRIPGGEVEVIEGTLTGILVDAAAERVKSIIPKPGKELLKQAFLKAQEKCLDVGLSGVSDAGLDREEIEALLELNQEKKLKIRVNAMLNPTLENFRFIDSVGKVNTPFLKIHSVKLYADGALGSRGALLKKPYCDDSLHIGLIQNAWSYYKETCMDLYNKGWQVNTHCIGDSANAGMLKVYGEILKGKNDRRWRIEHAQVVSAADRQYFGQYAILPSVQPTHATSDMYMAEDRLCSHRLGDAYAYKSLLKENGILPLGTDFPVESHNPLGTYFSAVTRKNAKGEPSGGFLAGEGLTFEEAIKGMTIWAAYGGFTDHETGSLEKGKFADFVLFEKDLRFLLNEKEAQLKQVWLNGERVR